MGIRIGGGEVMGRMVVVVALVKLVGVGIVRLG